MNYNDFLDYIKNSFRDLMGTDCNVALQKVIKNNDYELDALVIMEGDFNISPTIYLNDYFVQYKKGKKITEIVGKIYKLYCESKTTHNIDMAFLKDFSKIKDSIVFKLVNKESNSKLLLDVPYFEYLDLAIVFYVIINVESMKNCTALINNYHLELWNVEKSKLLDISSRNTPKLLKYSIKNMNDVINEIYYQEYSEDIEKTEIDAIDIENNMNMYVLTNQLKTNGAACILYEDVIKNFAKKIDKNVFIIPSSVHEVILVPDDNILVEELNTMVKQVNKEVERYEILSDHVYRYLLKEDKIIEEY